MPTRKTIIGAAVCSAPEVIDKAKNYNLLVDVWSLGIFAVELCIGSKPFSDK